MFRNFILQNFPMLEDDFDALTDYELFCKMMEYVKEFAKDNEEFKKQLSTYENYFKNLDVQTEINNKLDEMAQDGTLEELIAQYIKLQGLLMYNTIQDMKQATNLVNGSFAKTLGKNTYKDGLGNFYKIRTILNTDTIDEINIIALNDETLIAELIINTSLINVDDYKDPNDMDDTEAIIRAIDIGKNLPNPLLTFNKRDYYVSNLFNIDYKLNIDFNGASINFENNNINIRGDAKAIFYYDNNTKVNFVDVTSDLIEGTNVYTANLNDVNVNDFLVLKIEDTTNNELSSEHYFLTKVIEKDNNNYTLDYTIPATFNTFGYTAKLGKPSKVIENVEIKNGIINDLSSSTDPNVIVNGITFIGFYANSRIENVIFNNIGCHALNLRHTNNFKVDNIVVNTTRVQDAGHGYACRLQANLNNSISNSIVRNCRHFVDNTMCQNFNGYNLKAYKCSGAFTSHGQYEYNINYNNIFAKNCTYSLAFGDSDYTVTSYFMNFTRNVNINNALLFDRISSRGLSDFYFNNIKLKCANNTENLIGISGNCKIVNSEINGYIHLYLLKNLHRVILNKSLNEFIIDKSLIGYIYSDSSTTNEGIIKLLNSNLYQPYISAERGLRAENCIIDNCIINGETNAKPTVIYNFSTFINFTNNIINNSIKHTFKTNIKVVNILNNKWLNNRSSYGQYLMALENFNADTINISNNIINHQTTGSRGMLVFNDDSTCKTEIVANNSFRYALNGYLFPRNSKATSTICIVTGNIFENLNNNKPDTQPLTNQLFDNNLFV